MSMTGSSLSQGVAGGPAESLAEPGHAGAARACNSAKRGRRRVLSAAPDEWLQPPKEGGGVFKANVVDEDDSERDCATPA